MDKQAENYQYWNQLLTFLADKSSSQIDEASLVILAGNCLPILADKAAELYQKGQVKKIFLVGGIGHATVKLHRNFEKQGIFLDPTLSESEMCLQFLKGMPRLGVDIFL